MANFNEGSLNMNLTTSAGLEVVYQPVLNRHLLRTVKHNAIHHQFGQKVDIPKGKGKVVAWDKMSPLPKAKKPLEEGITPTGTAINVSRIKAYPEQYGAYIAITDQVDYFTPEPNREVLKYNEKLGDNAAETLDSLTADVLASGTNVQFAGGKTGRSALTSTDTLTVDEIRKATRTLKGNKAKPFDKDFVCIIHTDIAHDLMGDEKWVDVHKYSGTKEIYAGEIGRLYGVRFVESADAVMFRGDALGLCDESEGYDELTIYSVDNEQGDIVIAEELSTEEAAAIVSNNRTVIINGFTYTVNDAKAGMSGKAKLSLNGVLDASIKADMKIYPSGGDESGKPVYSTLVIGADAYGVTDPKSTLQNITKALGSAGTADPLDQRSTMGWKSYHCAKILEDLNMVRIESVSTRY